MVPLVCVCVCFSSSMSTRPTQLKIIPNRHSFFVVFAFCVQFGRNNATWGILCLIGIQGVLRSALIAGRFVGSSLHHQHHLK